MITQPALFVSHGSPMLLVEDGPAHRFLREWGGQHPRPTAIVVASAHWENRAGPLVSLAAQPRTIHDFGGFPRELYEAQYPAPGAPELAQQVLALLREAGFNAAASDNRGLDHGAWVPLQLMYPQADIPVLQVALMHGGSPAEHYRLGQALQPLRQQGVLVLGSGAITHNLYEIMGRRQEEAVPVWVSEFTDWVAAATAAGQVQELTQYRQRAPHAARNHPSEEHFLPLLVALGAGGAGALARRVHHSYTYGILAMDAYEFGTGGQHG